MGLTLFNEQINQTYPALIKFGDNQAISGTLKVLSDGQGTDLPVQISTGAVTFTAVVNVQAPTQNAHATTKLYVDTQIGNEETARINGDANLQTQIDQITAGNGSVVSIDGLSGTIDLVEGNEITITTNAVTDTITIGVSTALTDLISQINTNSTVALALAQNNLTLINTNAGDIQNLESGIGNVTAVKTTGQANINGVVEFAAGTNVTLGQSGQVITINASGTGGAAVDSVNGETGAITLESTDLDLLTITPDVGTGTINLEPKLPRTMLEDIKNVSAVTILKGRALHITGSTGNEAEVIYADAASGLAAHLIAWEDVAAGAVGKAVAVGFINNVLIPDTAPYPPGTELYLGNNGGFLPAKPTGTSIVQYLGVVFNRSVPSGNGSISGLIQNLGVENELPNLAQDNLWVGDSNGVPQEVSINSLPYVTDAELQADLDALKLTDLADTPAGYGTAGQVLATNATVDGTEWIDIPVGITINNNADNRIITGSNTANTLNGEFLLTYDGSTLNATGDVTATGDLNGDALNVKTINYSGFINIPLPSATFPQIGEISPIAGTGLTIGNLYYLSSTGWQPANASAVSTAAGHLGIAVSSTEVMIRGHIRDTLFAGFTLGDELYMKDSAGAITNVAPTTTGYVFRVLGYVVNAGARVIYFNPSNDYYTIE